MSIYKAKVINDNDICVILSTLSDLFKWMMRQAVGKIIAFGDAHLHGFNDHIALQLIFNEVGVKISFSAATRLTLMGRSFELIALNSLH